MAQNLALVLNIFNFVFWIYQMKNKRSPYTGIKS